MKIRTGIGQDSHRFVSEGDTKKLILGGLCIDGARGLLGNSDADVMLHALTNAISGVTGRPILGRIADAMCKEGITDSTKYLQVALSDLDQMRLSLVHVSLSIEAAIPKIEPIREKLCQNIASILKLDQSSVCITATTGEGLTAFGRGEGIQAFCVVTAQD